MDGQSEEVGGQGQSRPQPVFLRPWFGMLVVGIVCLIVGFAIAGNAVPPAPLAQSSHHPTAPTYSYSPRPPMTVVSTNGVYRVGDQLRPGVYRSDSNHGASGCHWTIASDMSGRQDSIKASASPVGTGFVSLMPGDVFITVQCSPWVLQPPPTGTPPGPPPPGESPPLPPSDGSPSGALSVQ